MTQWEYAFLHFLDEWSGGECVREMNKMGLQGWECVHANCREALFKRPISTAKKIANNEKPL